MSSALDVFNWNLGYFFTAAILSISTVGVQLFMWCYMVSRFRVTSTCTGIREAHVLYIVTSFVILVLTGAGAILWGFSIYDTLLKITPGEENIANGWDIIDSVYARLWVKGEIAVNIALWVSDALLAQDITPVEVYRCYVIWSDYFWIYSAPLILWLSTIALGIASFIPTVRTRTLDISNVFIVVVLHILITSLIGIRLVHAHRRLYKSCPLAKHDEYLSAMAILVESAAPLAVFGLGTAISGLFVNSVLAVKICWIFQTGLWISVMLAPQLIIFRVTTGRSWAMKSESIAILSRDFEAAVRSLNPEEVKECEEKSKRIALHGGTTSSDSSLRIV